MTAPEFVQRLDERNLSAVDRAIALLWWIGRADPTLGLAARACCEIAELAGHPKQNASRLHHQLAADRRTSKASAWSSRSTRATTSNCGTAVP
jgi:hypothetical protein